MKKIGLCLICLFCITGCQNTPVIPKEAILKNDDNRQSPINKKEEAKEPEVPIEESVTVEEVEPPIQEPVNEPSVEIPQAPSEKPQEEEPTPPPVEAEPISMVTISIECTTILNNMSKLKPGYKEFVPANGFILPIIQVEIQEGESVSSVLERACQLNEIKLSARNGYVSEIGNIGEFTCGNLSGWMYAVNGAYSNQSASQKTLQDGDSIKWMYTCDNGRDLTFN